MFRSALFLVVGLAIAAAGNVPSNANPTSETNHCLGPAPATHSLNPSAHRERFILVATQTQPTETSVFFRVNVRLHLHAELSNCSLENAHDVIVEARARVGADYIPIDGNEYLLLELGALPAGGKASRDVSFELTMSLGQGRFAERHGIIFELSVASDLGREPLPPLHCAAESCERLRPPVVGPAAQRLPFLTMGTGAQAALCPFRLGC